MNLKNPGAPPSVRNRRSQRAPKLTEEELNDIEGEEETQHCDLHTCKFSFRVPWDDSRNRWFIPQKQAGCKRHCGHPHLPPQLLRIQSRHATYWHKIKSGHPPHIQDKIGCRVDIDQESNGTDSSEVSDSVQNNDYDDARGKKGHHSDNAAVGGNNIVHHGSDYQLPPRMECDHNPVDAQEIDSEAAFLPAYEMICKIATAAGAEGRAVLEQELNVLRDKQLEIIAKKNKSLEQNNLYNEYRHLFKSVCNHTDDAGEEGRKLLREGLNALKGRQVDIITKNQSATTGIAYMPATSRNRVDKRITSVCSPKKRSK